MIPRPLHRRLLGATAAAAAAVAVLAAAVLTAPAAQADTQSVTVDLSSAQGTPSGSGRGFLYGLSTDGSGPADSLLQPLKPTSFRGGGEIDTDGSWGWALGAQQVVPRYNAVRGQMQRVTRAPYNATYDIILSDLWGSDGSGQRPANIAEPCDDGSACTNWVAFLNDLVTRLRNDNLLNSQVRFDIWNEPAANSYFWPRSIDQYYTMWNTAVRTLRQLYPGAVIVGPSIPNYDVTTMAGYLDHYKAAGTVPNIVNWHFSGDPVADAQNVRGLLSDRGITGVGLSMNEYLYSNEQTAGHTAWYLAQLQRANIPSASHAIWSDCCGSPYLDGTLINGSQPTGAYWAYRTSAAQTGTLVASTGSAGVDLLASRDDSAAQATILLGTKSTFSGTLNASISGISSGAAYLVKNNQVRVQVQRLTDGALSAPISVQNSLVTVANGAISVSIPWTASTDAYAVTLTAGDTSGTTDPGTSTTIDGNVKGTGTNQFDYGTGWGTTTGVSDMYAGTANWSSGANQTATFRFQGTQVQLYTVHDRDQGIMSVSVDGSTPVRVDDYAANRNAQALSWTSPTLASGSHTLTVVATGDRNGASSGSTIAIDKAQVNTALPTVVDGNVKGTGAGQFNYSSGWGSTSGVSDMYSGTANWCPTAGQTASFAFTGTQIGLYTVKDTDQGIMSVSVDNAAPVDVDDYSATRNAAGLTWTSPTLAAGSHTLHISVTGRKNGASAGTTIAVDKVQFS
jgi:hypothetical protein